MRISVYMNVLAPSLIDRDYEIKFNKINELQDKFKKWKTIKTDKISILLLKYPLFTLLLVFK